jgi:hypothetical protein
MAVGVHGFGIDSRRERGSLESHSSSYLIEHLVEESVHFSSSEDELTV